MQFLSLFIGKALAQAPAAPMGPGVDEMWKRICKVLVFCDKAGEDIPEFFAQRLVNFLFPLIVGAAVCTVIYAGIKMITEGEEGYTEAKTILLYVGIGLVLASLASVIILFLTTFLIPELLK